MMSGDETNDIESVFEEERDLDLSSLSNRNRWVTPKKIAIAVAAIAALVVLVIALPMNMMTKNEGDSDGSTATALGVGSDGADTEMDPTLDVTGENPHDSASSKDPMEDEPVTIEVPITFHVPNAYPGTMAPTSSNSGSTSSFVESVSTDTACLALNVSHGDATSWVQIADDIVGEAPGDLSGTAIGLSADGSIIAIASTENDGGGENAGHVRVYRYSLAGEFVTLGQELEGEAKGDWFGDSVALDATGFRLAAGGRWNDGGGEDSGHVRVFDYSETTDKWDQVGEDIDGANANNKFGNSVSLSADGRRLAVGASFCNGSRNLTNIGCAYLYELVEGSWILLAQLEGDVEGDLFGKAVELSDDGSYFAVGSQLYDAPNGGTDAGQVKVFKYDSMTSNLTKVGQNIKGEGPGDWTGLTLSLSADGNRVAVGFPGDNSGIIPTPGFARVYELTDGAWVQMGSQDLTGGFSVSLSRDGHRVAVGDYKGSNGGIISGHVYIYDFNTETLDWEEVGEEINGKSEEMSGLSVALSADGMRVAIAAPRASSNGNQVVGATRVYDAC